MREKINELKSLRLYLLVSFLCVPWHYIKTHFRLQMCQANIKSIDMNNLEIMFNVNSNSQQIGNSSMKTERILQGKSVSNILISLYGP